MKKLFYFLTVVALLTMGAVGAKAAKFYVVGDFNNWADGADELTQSPWTLTMTGAEWYKKTLNQGRDGWMHVLIHAVEEGNSNSWYIKPASGGGNIFTGSQVAFSSNYNNSGGEDGYFKVENTDAKTYTLHITWETEQNNCKVWVTSDELQLASIVSNWGGTTYESYNKSTGIYTWAWEASQMKSMDPAPTNGQYIEFKLISNGTWMTAAETGTETEIGEEWVEVTTSGGTDNNMYIVYDPKLTSVIIQAMPIDGGYKMRTMKVYPHDFYWVSPQITNNQKLERFKMVASRNRTQDGQNKTGDGNTSYKYFSYTVKDDDLAKNYIGNAVANGTDIEWYIVRDDNKEWFRPSVANRTYDSTGDIDDYITYQNFNNDRVTDANNNYMYSFEKGLGKSYTFILNIVNGNVYLDYARASAPTNVNYELIGTFDGDAAFENGFAKKEMTKYWYVGNMAYTTEQASADSIVYKVKVDRPTAGWKNLYIDVNPVGNTSWSDYGTNGAMFRPLISFGNNLDGRALKGGMVTYNSDQSLNPEPNSSYTSYTFTFNATTMTYSLEFHSSLYLVGPAVSTTEGQKGSWDISNISTNDPRIPLEATQDTEVKHFRNLVYFTKGQQFRFLRNEDENATKTYADTWGENDNKPKWVSATAEGEYYPTNETQYHNYLVPSNGGTGSTAPSNSDNNITFDLPSGWYYINFYPEGISSTYTTTLYTIERKMELRDFETVKYKGNTRTITGRGDYNFFRVWSDHIAWTKPQDVDMFIVTAFNAPANSNEPATITLSKLNYEYIPAKIGVILASKSDKNSLVAGQVYTPTESTTGYNNVWIDMEPYDHASNSYTGDSKIIPLYDSRELPQSEEEEGTSYTNYLFGFYNAARVDRSVTDNSLFYLGFWQTTGVGNTYANSGFLRLTSEEAARLGVGQKYDGIETLSAAPCFMINWDDITETDPTEEPVVEPVPEPVVDGIVTINSQKRTDNKWYTLEGVRISHPTKGIYIVNGKKVVVK